MESVRVRRASEKWFLDVDGDMNWDLERVRGVLVDWILVIVCVRFVIG